MTPFTTIRDRASFVRLSSGNRFVVSCFILLYAPNPEKSQKECRVGYTATKKLGGAVVRNRIKRRLREAVRQVVPVHGKTGYDYVFIARSKVSTCDFSELVREMEFAFSRIKGK